MTNASLCIGVDEHAPSENLPAASRPARQSRRHHNVPVSNAEKIMARQSASPATFSPATVETYAKLDRQFQDWCARRNLCAHPIANDVLVEYLQCGASRWRRSTVKNAIAAIAHHERHRGRAVDTKTLNFFARAFCAGKGAPRRTAHAIDRPTLNAVCADLPDTPLGLRDRAIFALGFAAALRPNELLGLEVGARSPAAKGTLKFNSSGMTIELNRRKFVQRGHSEAKFIPRGLTPCAVIATEQWIARAGINAGPLFRKCSRSGAVHHEALSALALRRLLRRHVAKAWRHRGVPEREVQERIVRISGNSLRAGFVTAAVARNVNVTLLSRHLGWSASHSSSHMAVRYNRPGAAEDFKMLEDILALSEGS